MTAWTCALELDAARQPAGGSAEALAGAIRRGADLRIYTEFIHNEHIDVTSTNPERIREVAEFGVTYLLEDRWTAGIMSLRQPISLPDRFGPRPSMSFFLYNQNGDQAIARPHLDGAAAAGPPGPAPAADLPGMHKYHARDGWDAATNAPSSNFVYDFDVYRFYVDDAWQEVLAHDATGVVQRGAVAALVEAFAGGRPVKVGVRGLCGALAERAEDAVAHELFVQTGSCYYYTEQRLFLAGSHPVIRVQPRIPMRYASRGWDFGWLMLRTDGHVVYRRCDPYTLAFQDLPLRLPIRWFVR